MTADFYEPSASRCVLPHFVVPTAGIVTNVDIFKERFFVAVIGALDGGITFVGEFCLGAAAAPWAINDQHVYTSLVQLCPWPGTLFIQYSAGFETVEGQGLVVRVRAILRDSVREHISGTWRRFEPAIAPAAIDVEII